VPAGTREHRESYLESGDSGFRSGTVLRLHPKRLVDRHENATAPRAAVADGIDEPSHTRGGLAPLLLPFFPAGPATPGMRQAAATSFLSDSFPFLVVAAVIAWCGVARLLLDSWREVRHGNLIDIGLSCFLTGVALVIALLATLLAVASEAA